MLLVVNVGRAGKNEKKKSCVGPSYQDFVKTDKKIKNQRVSTVREPLLMVMNVGRPGKNEKKKNCIGSLHQD